MASFNGRRWSKKDIGYQFISTRDFGFGLNQFRIEQYFAEACAKWAPHCEFVREHHEGLQSFRSMRRMEASLRKASALRLRFSQSLAGRRQRLSQPMVRSTIQRFGSRRPESQVACELIVAELDVTESSVNVPGEFARDAPIPSYD